MKKMYRICIILGCLSCGMSATADEVKRVVTPLSLGFDSLSQFPSGDLDVTVYGLRAGVWMGFKSWDFTNHVYGISLGLLATTDYEVTGLQLSVLYNEIMKEWRGFQIAGLLNTGEGRGLQCAGLVNLGEVKGLQCAGLVNVGKNARGLQCAGFWNLGINDVTGIQIASGFNCLEEFKGADNSTMTGIQLAGLMNHAENVDGIQVAAVNFAKKISGVQIGLLNWADESLKGLQVGLLNHKPGFYFPGLMVGW